MKTAIYILLFANLAFFAWATWIDTPAHGASAQSTAGLPRLVLAGEAQAKNQASPASRQATVSEARCVSVGPFTTPERVASAASILTERGYAPSRREEPGESSDGYWVYVEGLQTAFDQARVMHILEQAKLTDARVMPESAEGKRRISVGLFSERVRAERRARVLQRLGLKPEIGERRVPGAVYWLNVNLGPEEREFSAEGLLSPEEANPGLEVRGCPAVQSAPASG